MTIHKTRWFDRWARKNGLRDMSLCAAVHEMTKGLFDADLGAGLYKKRIAREGQGKSGGFRTLIATNKASRWMFLYGFPKSERDNIEPGEEEALKKLAGALLMLTAAAIRQAEEAGELIEVFCDEKDEVIDP